MATRMQQRRGTAAQWTAANPILAAGEIGFETDTNKFKMGNGTSTWTALQYFANAAELAAIIDGAPELLNTLNELAASLGDDPDFFGTINSTINSSVEDHALDTTNIHGIADTSALATKVYADGAVTTHNGDTTNVHGIADTSALALSATVATDISDAVTAHNTDTTNVHGIADTSVLVTTEDLNDHINATTGVHGIADTSLLATTSNVSDAASAAASALSDHNVATENVHGILDTTLLATQDYVDTAVSSSTVDQSLLAGTGIDWNSLDERFDIDSTIATKTYADTAVSDHNAETTSVHGIADTSLLATQSYADLAVSNHSADTTDIHGIADTSVLETVTGSQDKADSAQSAAEATAAGLYATKVDASITGTATVENITVTGNLTVQGTTTTVDATNLEVTDSLIYLAAEQFDTDALDIGIFGAYGDVNAGHLHTGMVRDASDGKWKLISNGAEPTSSEVDFSAVTYDTLKLGGVEFSDGTQTKEGTPSQTAIVQKTDSYTLSALTERDSLIEVAKSTATTITIPLNSAVAFPVGTSIDILQTSTGQVTIAGAAGVTVNATPGLKLRTTWSSATLFKRAENTWVVYGDLTA